MPEFNNKTMHQLFQEIPCLSNPLLSASVLVDSMYDGVGINFTFAKKYGEDGHLVANYLPAWLFHHYGEGIMKYLLDPGCPESGIGYRVGWWQGTSSVNNRITRPRMFGRGTEWMGQQQCLFGEFQQLPVKRPDRVHKEGYILDPEECSLPLYKCGEKGNVEKVKETRQQDTCPPLMITALTYNLPPAEDEITMGDSMVDTCKYGALHSRFMWQHGSNQEWLTKSPTSPSQSQFLCSISFRCW